MAILAFAPCVMTVIMDAWTPLAHEWTLGRSGALCQFGKAHLGRWVCVDLNFGHDDFCPLIWNDLGSSGRDVTSFFFVALLLAILGVSACCSILEVCTPIPATNYSACYSTTGKRPNVASGSCQTRAEHFEHSMPLPEGRHHSAGHLVPPCYPTLATAFVRSRPQLATAAAAQQQQVAARMAQTLCCVDKMLKGKTNELVTSTAGERGMLVSS